MLRLLHRSQQAVSEPFTACVKDCPSPCSGLILIMAASSSTICCIATVWTSTSLLPVLDHTRRTIKRMWSRRIGPLCDGWLAMNRWETQHELALLENVYEDLRPYINFFQPSFKLIAKERIGNQTLRRYDPAKTPYLRVFNAKTFRWKPKPGSPTFMFNSIPPNFGAVLTRKLPIFGNFLGNILP